MAQLAEVLRPKKLDAVVGKDGLFGRDGHLQLMLAPSNLGSIILWEPSGTGKTTIARLSVGAADMVFEPTSTVFDGVDELRKIFAHNEEWRQDGQCTLLFGDEAHRFNKVQHDGLLPRVEDGTVTLVGATTENHSFAPNMVVFRIDRPEKHTLGTTTIAQIFVARSSAFDKAGSQHYNLMSALHKTLLASVADIGL